MNNPLFKIYFHLSKMFFVLEVVVFFNIHSVILPESILAGNYDQKGRRINGYHG